MNTAFVLDIGDKRYLPVWMEVEGKIMQIEPNTIITTGMEGLISSFHDNCDSIQLLKSNGEIKAGVKIIL